MSKLVELSNFQPTSFSACLRRLYREIDRIPSSEISSPKHCEKFYQETRGYFLKISRSKKNITLENAGKHLGIPCMLLEVIEKGQAPITDLAFIRLCQYYGTAYEASIFAEKIEKVLAPKLQHSRD